MSSFIAAMDHSGGSTNKTLERYGLHDFDEDQKFDLIHAMRMRIVNSPAFNSNNIWAAILFKDTVDRGMVPLLLKKEIASFLKIDSGILFNGMLKQFDVHSMIKFAKDSNCVGTKMRSLIHFKESIPALLKEQFDLASIIFKNGLIPIVEPEVPINHSNKKELEAILFQELQKCLSEFDGKCILKLTPPEQPNLYQEFTEYHKVAKVVFLSGGYSTDEACRRLQAHSKVSASFSRALTEGLNFDMSDDVFNALLSSHIKMIERVSSQ